MIKLRKWLKTLAVTLTVAALLSVSLIAIAQKDVAISPQTLNLEQFVGDAITVHAAFDYDDVAGSVTLTSKYGSPITAVSTFADNRGDLVAKFSIGDVEGIVEEGEVTLTLYEDGEEIGSDTIRVIYGDNKKGE